VKWALNYLDASDGQWKLILDVWLARYRFGRAHIILNTPLDKLIAPINKNNAEASSLPDFWKEAITHRSEGTRTQTKTDLPPWGGVPTLME